MLYHASPAPGGVISASTPATKGESVRDGARLRSILILFAATALMVSYIETMIVPGLPNFASFFADAPLTSVTWILSAYLIVGVAITPIAGKLGDIYGKKRVLVAILSVYFIAVATAGFTPDIGTPLGIGRGDQLYLLIGVRAVQGIGMGIFPLAYAMIGEEFPREKMAFSRSIVSAMFVIGASVGLLGGAWVTQEYGWQLTYQTMIPIAGTVLALAAFLLRESQVRLPQRIDIPGATSLALTLTFFLLGLTEGANWGWTQWSAYSLAGVPLGAPEFFLLSAAFLIAFILVERRSPRPIVDFAKLAERNVLIANAVGLFASTAMFLGYVGLVARVELPAPVGLGKTYLDFGLYIVPATLTTMAAVLFVGRSLHKYGPKPAMLFGSILIVGGGAWLAAFNTTVPDMIIGPIPTLVGVIVIYVALTQLIVLSSKPQEVGVTTGMNQTFRNLGNAIGPVVASTILASLLTTYIVLIPNPPSTPIEHAFQAPSAAAFRCL